MTERQGSRRKQLLGNLKKTRGCWKLRESTLSHSLENWLWKRLWTCRKTAYRENE